MNCKQGDLAMVIRSSSGNEGKIVRCLRLSPYAGLRRLDGSLRHGPVWETDTLMPRLGTEPPNPYCMDMDLRPIRDPGDDAKDEMLRPLPQEITA